MSSPKHSSKDSADQNARPRYEYMLGQLISVEWYNPKTDKNEWREAKFLHHHDADDRLWRGEIEIDGRRVTGIAPECIKPREPAAPQPAKAAQTRDDLLHDLSFTELALEQTKAELQRVKESLAVAQSQIDNNDVTLAQVKLAHKWQLKRVEQSRLYDLVRYCRVELHQAKLITDEEYAQLVETGSKSARRLEDYEQVKQQLAIAESCLKNNDAAFETVKQQRDELLAIVRDVYTRLPIGPRDNEDIYERCKAAIASAEGRAS